MPDFNHAPVSIPAGSFDSADLARALEKAGAETDHARRSAILDEAFGIAAAKPEPVAEESKTAPVLETVKPEDAPKKK